MIARIRPETRHSQLFRSLLPAGDDVTVLEQELKSYFGVEEVLLTQGGRVGLYYLLKALPHKKVYLSAYTCWAVSDAIRLAGKELEYVDIQLADYNMDIDKLSETLVPESILLATHQFGIPCDMEAINKLAAEKNCLVLEDNAAGFGSTYKGKKTGTFSIASIISFEFSKTLTCGIGGAILFNNRDFYLKVKNLYDDEAKEAGRFETLKYLAYLSGYLLSTNKGFYYLTHLLFSRTKGMTTGYPPGASSEEKDQYFSAFDNVRAKLVHLGMKDIDRVIARKIEISNYYLTQLADCKNIVMPAYPDEKVPVFMRFPIRVKTLNKEDFYGKCVRKGLDLAFTFSYSCDPDTMKSRNAGRAAETVLNLPVYSKLSDNDLQKIKEVILSL